MAKVRLERITKTFGNVLAVNDLSLDIRDREFLTSVGPGGSDKTTTPRLNAGLEQQDSGNIYIGDELTNEVRVGQWAYRWYSKIMRYGLI